MSEFDRKNEPLAEDASDDEAWAEFAKAINGDNEDGSEEEDSYDPEDENEDDEDEDYADAETDEEDDLAVKEAVDFSAYDNPDDADEEDDEDDFADLAERITGMRHSHVVTAAPIRVREDDRTGSLTNPAVDGVRLTDALAADGPSSRIGYLVPGAVLIALLTVILLAIMHGASGNVTVPGELPGVSEAESADLSESASPKQTETETEAADPENPSQSEESLDPVEKTPAEGTATPEEPDDSDAPNDQNDPKEPEPVKPDEPDTKPADEKTPESAESTESAEVPFQTESEPEPKTEPEPEKEPEPQSVPEQVVAPEPEPEPEFWLQINFYDREPIGLMTKATTLRQVLADNNIWLTEAEVPSVDLDAQLTEYTNVMIDKYTWDTVTVSEEIPFSSDVTELDTIPKGTANYIRTGEPGQKDTVYTVKYKNGEEVERYTASETVVKWPVSEQYEIGVGGTLLGNDGNFYNYSYRRTVPATYYNLEGLTYLGGMADESVIAVDKDYIPLGTQVYVKNNRYDFGVRTAADIGSGVDSWEIDVWLSESNPYYPMFSSEGYIYDMEIYYLE